MFCEYSGEFHNVWENFGQKGILVISRKFLRFPCSSVISDPEMRSDVDFDGRIER
mgnify:CR=1 FL=1